MAANPQGGENKFPYFKPKRNEAMQAIRKLVVDGYSYQEVMEQLQLSERTFTAILG